MVLLHDHAEDQNKIEDNYKSELFVVESKHWDSNAYTIKPPNGKSAMCMVNQWQLFDHQRSQGDNLLDQAPDTNWPINLPKKIPEGKPPQISHQYDTRSKAKVNSILLDSSLEDEENFCIGSLIGSLMRKLKWL